MSDPIYHFVKGEGWVVTTNNNTTRIVKTLNGQMFKLTIRAPVPGERVMQVSHYDPMYTLAGDIVNMDRVVQFFETSPNPRVFFYLVPHGGYIDGHHTVVVEKYE